MSVGGSILQGLGQIFAGRNADQMGRSQERALNQGADQVALESGIAASMALERGERQAADLLVTAAGAGAGTGGSALMVMRDLERQLAFQSKNIVIEGQNKRQSLLFQAKIARRQGQVTAMGHYLNAGASFLNAADSASAAKAGVSG